MFVSRFLLNALASVGVLAALTVLDLGPRATAAYLSMASKQASAELDVGASADDDSDSLEKSDPERVYNLQLLNTPAHLARGASMVPPPSNPSGSPLVVAALAPARPPTSSLVVYFREPPNSLPFSAFVDSLLDPPRAV